MRGVLGRLLGYRFEYTSRDRARAQGSVKANDPVAALRLHRGVSPHAISMNCLPFADRYFIGVAGALAGRSPAQSVVPLSTSKARRVVARAAAMNTRPPALVRAPPRLGDPSGTLRERSTAQPSCRAAPPSGCLRW